MRYFLISLVIHCACFILYDAGTWFPAIKTAADPVGRLARLEVHLAPRGETVVADLALTAASVERQVAVRTIGKPKGGGLPRVPNDAAPELVSEVDTEIHDFRVTGFMILALEVDDQGVPGNAEVIYSDLPAETVELLAKIRCGQVQAGIEKWASDRGVDSDAYRCRLTEILQF